MDAKRLQEIKRQVMVGEYLTHDKMVKAIDNAISELAISAPVVLLDRLGPIRLMQGEWSGLTLRGELVQMGDAYSTYFIILDGQPWWGRAVSRRKVRQFPSLGIAAKEFEDVRQTAQTMSVGPFIAPITAF